MTAFPSPDQRLAPLPDSPFRRPAARASHPAGHGPLRPEEDGAVGALSFGALKAIAAGMARSQQAVPPGDDDPAAARSLRLLATAFYDVWLITWPDGSGLAAHDHGGSRSVLHVVEGELVEIFADHVDRPVPTGRVLRRGDATTAGPSFVHDLANRSGADATSLHVYSPPLTDVTFFDLQPIGGYERLRTTAVDGPEPQASSADLAPLRPPPLALVTPPDPG